MAELQGTLMLRAGSLETGQQQAACGTHQLSPHLGAREENCSAMVPPGLVPLWLKGSVAQRWRSRSRARALAMRALSPQSALPLISSVTLGKSRVLCAHRIVDDNANASNVVLFFKILFIYF